MVLLLTTMRVRISNLTDFSVLFFYSYLMLNRSSEGEKKNVEMNIKAPTTTFINQRRHLKSTNSTKRKMKKNNQPTNNNKFRNVFFQKRQFLCVNVSRAQSRFRWSNDDVDCRSFDTSTNDRKTVSIFVVFFFLLLLLLAIRSAKSNQIIKIRAFALDNSINAIH